MLCYRCARFTALVTDETAYCKGCRASRPLTFDERELL